METCGNRVSLSVNHQQRIWQFPWKITVLLKLPKWNWKHSSWSIYLHTYVHASCVSPPSPNVWVKSVWESRIILTERSTNHLTCPYWSEGPFRLIMIWLIVAISTLFRFSSWSVLNERLTRFRHLRYFERDIAPQNWVMEIFISRKVSLRKFVDPWVWRGVRGMSFCTS